MLRMKAFYILSSATALLPGVFAHYAFSALYINGNLTDEYEYVRGHQDRNPTKFSDPPLDFACRTGSFATANSTKTAVINAGKDELGFLSAANPSKADKWGPYAINHPGPLGIYLSKAPTGDVRGYDGSGEWFKIYELGYNQTRQALNSSSQAEWFPREITPYNMRFRIPETTPPGQYLLRAQHIFPHTTTQAMQTFVNCAQVEIRGPGGGTPAPLVHLADFLNVNNTDLIVSLGMQNGQVVDPGYKMPGPSVWTGN